MRLAFRAESRGAAATCRRAAQSSQDRHLSCGSCGRSLEEDSMKKWLAAAALLVMVGACDTRPELAAPDRIRGPTGLGSALVDPALAAALATAASAARL